MIVVYKKISVLCGLLILSGCTVKSEAESDPNIKSTLKHTEQCLTQLMDIVSNERNFALIKNNISRKDLILDVKPKDAQVELIHVSSLKSDDDEMNPMGLIKVNKLDKTINNITFGDTPIIPIKLGKHTNFVQDCF